MIAEDKSDHTLFLGVVQPRRHSDTRTSTALPRRQYEMRWIPRRRRQMHRGVARARLQLDACTGWLRVGHVPQPVLAVELQARRAAGGGTQQCGAVK